MAFDVKTDHKIVAGGDDLMQLLDSNTLAVVITATRNPASGEWTIHAENGSVPDLIAPTVAGGAQPRSEVISAMISQALDALPGTGYSCVVPHGLPETP
jgi:hypothetical protein